MSKKSNSIETNSRAAALAAIPVINTAVRVELLKNGELLIHYPATVRPWLLKLARVIGKVPQPIDRKVQLDVLGTAVWCSVDGRRSVAQIIEKFAKNHKLHPKEAEVSVTQFLRSLGQRGLIGLQPGGSE